MIQKISNQMFLNRASLGNMADVRFDVTVAEQSGKESVAHIESTIHYFEAGEGPALLLLHGAADSLYAFREIIEPLSASFRVIAPDLLGHGYSGCPEITYTAEEHALSLHAFLNALPLGRTHILAFGQGVGYALELAAMNPERIGRIIMINPGALVKTGFPGIRLLASPFGSHFSGRLAKPSFWQKCLEKCWFDKTLVTQELASEYAKPYEKAPDVRVCTRMSIANYSDDGPLAKLNELEKKVLLITTEDDTVLDGDTTQQYLAHIRDGYELSLRNCGFYPQAEKPDRVLETVLEFLK